MDIDEKQLEELLIKAYEEGWYGSKDLAVEISKKIILDFQNKQKSQQPQAPKKKKARKKQSTAEAIVNSSSWGDLQAIRMEGNSITFNGGNGFISYGVADRDRGRRVASMPPTSGNIPIRRSRSAELVPPPQSYVEAEAEAAASSMERIQATLPGYSEDGIRHGEAVYGSQRHTADIERRNEAARIAAETSTRLAESAESIEMDERTALEQQAIEQRNEFVEMAAGAGIGADEVRRLERVTRPAETTAETTALEREGITFPSQGYGRGERPSEPNPCMEVDIDGHPIRGWQRYFPSSFVEESIAPIIRVNEVVAEETPIGSEAAAEETTEVDL